MAEFVGRSDNYALFTSGDHGVVVDSTFNLVVASGQTDLLKKTQEWADGEFSDTDAETASVALSQITPEPATPTGRLYTIPKGVRKSAEIALANQKKYGRGGSVVAAHTASLLASGGQISFPTLQTVANYFAQHKSDFAPITSSGDISNEAITFGMWGGDAGARWSMAIVGREEPLLAEDPIVELSDVMDDDDPEITSEFIARVRMDGSGIDRLYRIDVDGAVFVWDDGKWATLGPVDNDIWSLDKQLDGPGEAEIDKTHVTIDPGSAVVLAAQFQKNPYQPVSIEDIDSYEAALAAEAGADEDADWDMVDFAMVAAPLPAGKTGGMDKTIDNSPGVFDPQERGEAVKSQPRDKNGKFAKKDSRVVVGGDAEKGSGVITAVNPGTGEVDILLDNGSSITVPSKSMELEADFVAPPVRQPNQAGKVVDTTGILGEPRVPINKPLATVPGTLPVMSRQAIETMLNDWPAYVKMTREGYSGDVRGQSVPVKAKNSTDSKPIDGKTIPTDPYDHPLLKKWIAGKDRQGRNNDPFWYNPITAAGAVPPAPTEERAKAMTPDTSDVQPVYMAVIDPEDPRAVLKLISIVPASSKSNQPMTYTREDGAWTRDPQVLTDLQSATPPPVVPLDKETLDDVITQVDQTQASGESVEAAPDGGPVETEPATEPEATPAPVEEPVTASVNERITLDLALTVLYGTQPKKLAAAMLAAGGIDRNRGNAEELRRYWTHGEGAAKIRWGTPGDWKRCVRYLAKHMGERAKGYCQLRHKEATGIYTTTHAKRDRGNK